MAQLYPYIDDLLADAAATPNQTLKTEIWHEIQDIYAEWVPGIPLFRPVAYDFTLKTVEGVLVTPIGPDIRFYATKITG
jgi:ABC-type transport system substrate-binding protein